MSRGSGEPVFTTTPDTSTIEVNPSKKQKGKKVVKEKTVVIDPEDPLISKERSKYHVMEKEFPYSEFMDRELMVPALLERLEGNDENLAAKIQWAGCALLKLAALLRYSEPVVTSGVRALGEVKVLKERISLLQNEKEALEKAKRDETNELREQLQSLDSQLDGLQDRISELEKDRDAAVEDAATAKVEVVHVERLWAQSAHEIKNNLLDQCQVICIDADFGEVGLDKIIVEGHIEVAPDDSEDIGTLDADLPANS